MKTQVLDTGTRGKSRFVIAEQRNCGVCNCYYRARSKADDIRWYTLPVGKRFNCKRDVLNKYQQNLKIMVYIYHI